MDIDVKEIGTVSVVAPHGDIDMAVADDFRLRLATLLDRGRARLVLDLGAGIDTVFHEAALVSVPQSVEAPELSCDINAHGTARILDAARRAGVRRIVFASSAAVYGDTAALPVSEREPVRPVSPY